MPNRGASATAVTWMGHRQAHTPDFLWLPDSSPAQPPPPLGFAKSSAAGGCRLSLHTQKVGSWRIHFLKSSGSCMCCLSGRSWSQASSEGRKNHSWGNQAHSESLCRLLNCTTGLLLLLCLPPSPVRALAPQEVRPPCISGHRGRERLSISGMGMTPPTHTPTNLETKPKANNKAACLQQLLATWLARRSVH